MGRGMVYSFALAVKGFNLKLGVTRESYVEWPSMSPGTGTIEQHHVSRFEYIIEIRKMQLQGHTHQHDYLDPGSRPLLSRGRRS